jgi:hypothetical protein
VIQFPNLNKGILIYAQNTTDDAELGRIIELRVSNEFNYQYQARYFGIYLPTYKLSGGDVDRLLIQLPPVESEVVYPIYLERMVSSNIYTEDSLVEFYDNLRNPQYLDPRPGADYTITREGFRFKTGKVRLLHETLPVKIKLHIPNITSHGKFHLYNPSTGYLMWTVEIDGLDIYINDTLETTLANENEIEMDIGFDETSLRLNFFETYDLLYTTEDSSPLNTMPSVSDSILEFEGLEDMDIDWLLCYQACFKNSEVYSVMDYTDFEMLVISGQPTLTHINKFGIQTNVANNETEEIGIKRLVTDAELHQNGMKVVKRDNWSYSNPLELLVYNAISEIHPLEITIINQCSYSHPVKFPVGGAITTAITLGMVGSKTELSEYGEYGIKAIKHNYKNHELGLQRMVALQEDYYWGMQPTHLKDVVLFGEFAMTPRIERELLEEEIILMAIKKIVANIYIESETYEKNYLESNFTGGGIESK